MNVLSLFHNVFLNSENSSLNYLILNFPLFLLLLTTEKIKLLHKGYYVVPFNKHDFFFQKSTFSKLSSLKMHKKY